tara:strand:- start:118 stop:456 length:339 start_codon:yes stop_codon:yes gene_type:complete
MTVGKVKDFSSGGMTNGYAKGGKAMETPRMKRETVRAPSAPQGMIKNRGALGVIANKNPGEMRNNTAPNLPGDKMMMKHGGSAKGMHRMPDGKMMKNSEHKEMMGGTSKKSK